MAKNTLSQDTLDEEERRKKEKAAKEAKKKKTATSILGGIGTVLAGPVGGAAITAGAGAVDANRADKATDPNRPKRRRLTAALDAAKDRKKTKEQALATLSQAVFDWSNSIR